MVINNWSEYPVHKTQVFPVIYPRAIAYRVVAPVKLAKLRGNKNKVRGITQPAQMYAVNAEDWGNS